MPTMYGMERTYQPGIGREGGRPRRLMKELCCSRKRVRKRALNKNASPSAAKASVPKSQ